MSIPQQPGYGPPQPVPPEPSPGRRVPWAVFAVACLLAVAAVVTMTLYATGVVGGSEPKIEKPDAEKNVPPNPYKDPAETPYGYVDDLCERLDWTSFAETLEFSTEDVTAEYQPDLHSAKMVCRVGGDDTNSGDVGVNFTASTYTTPETAIEMYTYSDVDPEAKGAEKLSDVDAGAIQIGSSASEGNTIINFSVLDGNFMMFGSTEFPDADAEAGEKMTRDAIDSILTLSKEV